MALDIASHIASTETMDGIAHDCTSIWAPACPAHIHRPPTPPAPFRFLDLPGELQNRIVEEFLTSSEPIPIRMPQYNRHPYPPPKMRERPRYDRHVPPTPPLSRSASSTSTRTIDQDIGHTRLALMLTCRKLYREHWRTYYGQNIFEFNLETFCKYLDQIPRRCAQQIRRIRFRMPHKYHHGRIWSMLSHLKRLEEVEIALCAPSQPEEIEYKQAHDGIRHCKRLLRFSFSRAQDVDVKSDEPQQPEELAELREQVMKKDREVEEEICLYLRSRESQRREKERTRSRPVHRLRDCDFPNTEGESSSSG